MKNKIAFAAAAAALAAFPGAAQAQEGASAHPYVGVQVGIHDLGIDRDAFPPLQLDDNGMIYGGYFGVDFDVGTNVVLGLEGNFNLGTSAIDSDYGASARIGVRAGTGTIVFVRGGYQWVNLDVENFTGVPNLPAGIEDTADDYLVGVGADVSTGGNMRFRVALDTISFDSIRPTVGVNFTF